MSTKRSTVTQCAL